MNILGLNTGLNSSAVLLRDGKPVFAIQEERLSRIKNQPGFPVLSIGAALEDAGLTIKDIDVAAVAGTGALIAQSREDDLGKFHNRYNAVKKQWFGDSESILEKLAKKGLSKIASLTGGKPAAGKVVKDLDTCLREAGLAQKAACFDHHLCHAASAYYGLAKNRGEKHLVFSMDGGGDGKTSAVYIGENGTLTEIASSDSFSPACLYAHVTYIMGFLPHEHEYKLMGLAPYAQPKYAAVARDVLATFIGFSKDNPLILTNTGRYPNVRNSRGPHKQELVHDLFKETLNIRFDTLAAGLQLLAEETAVSWVRAGMEKTGIKNVLLTGGFFMNVKANKLISELPGLEYLNCFPSCGDESNAFGAAFLAHEQSKEPKAGIKFGNICLGTQASSDIKEAIDKYAGKVSFEKIPDINGKTAELLAAGRIVARCSGRMEFGARALGNRSILASPDNPLIINKINAAIKKRDFWMPFAPAVLRDKAESVIDIPGPLKQSGSPYMMFTFNARPEASEKLIAGIHQADKTARAELVTKESQPDFYDIIERFHAKTGIPAVLNTSFNLHGYPIVNAACDAVDVLLNSELDALVIDDYLVTKK